MTARNMRPNLVRVIDLDIDGTLGVLCYVMDLVLYSDRETNLCEMKFCDEPFEVSAEYARHLRDRTALFKSATKTRASCHVTFVATYGVKRGKNSSIVNSEVRMDDLFKEI